MLLRSWFFKISTFALVVLITPILGTYLHAPISTLILIIFATMVGLLENAFVPALNSFSNVMGKNKLLLYFLFWYCACVIINLLIGGKGLSDWRLMLDPIMLLIVILFAFTFISNPGCERYFQISIIIALGMQSILTIPQLYLNPNIARQMWAELSGTWIYGDQGYFAMSAFLLPVFFWRSFKETGILKYILLTCSVLILIAAGISSFATPLGLIVIGISVTIIFSLVFMIRRKGCFVAGVLITISLLGYQFILNNDLFAESYSRIHNFLSDPTSGGYSGRDIIDSRWRLDAISVESFLKSPIFGMGGGSTRYSEYAGAHSSMFDTLAVYGILGGGGAFLMVIIILLTNSIRKFFKKLNWQNMLILTSVTMFVVAGIINPYWEGTHALFLILVAHPFISDKLPGNMAGAV